MAVRIFGMSQHRNDANALYNAESAWPHERNRSSLLNSHPKSPTNQQTHASDSLLHFITAAFLATGTLADTNAASISKVSDPSHRSLRKHHHTTDVDDEERGIKDIPLDRLNSLGRKVSVNAGNNPGVAMRGMTKARVDAWIAGLKKLKKLYKQAEAPRIKNPSYRS